MKRRGAERAESAEKRGRLREISETLNRVSHAAIGAAIAVHEELGPGYLESIYEEALAIELTQRGIPFERQLRIPIYFREFLVGESRLDLVVDASVVIELKAVDELRPIHHAQLLSYLHAGAYELGLLLNLLNFNVPRLVDGVRRLVLTV